MRDRVDTAEEALPVAEALMLEFAREMNSIPLAEVQAVHAPVDDDEMADGFDGDRCRWRGSGE
jgi:hypothetical protein